MTQTATEKRRWRPTSVRPRAAHAALIGYAAAVLAAHVDTGTAWAAAEAKRTGLPERALTPAHVSLSMRLSSAFLRWDFLGFGDWISAPLVASDLELSIDKWNI